MNVLVTASLAGSGGFWELMCEKEFEIYFDVLDEGKYREDTCIQLQSILNTSMKSQAAQSPRGNYSRSSEAYID